MESRRSVVVGVDASVESSRAAASGWRIAEAAKVECRLVHVISDALASAANIGAPPTLKSLVVRNTRQALENALRGSVPQAVLSGLDIQFGWPPTVLRRLASDSGMMVVGGKRHTTLGRWLVGSTVHRVLRDLDVPLLVAGPAGDTPYRILVALDLSRTAQSVLVEAHRLARLFRARLAVVHVVEPLPALYAPVGLLGIPETMSDQEWADASQEAFDRTIWPLVDYAGAEKLVCRGSIVDTIRAEVERWRADLLIVGSHGRGWTEHVFTGSTIHGLLSDLPTSLLVVPTGRPETVPSMVTPAPSWLQA